MSLTLTQRLHLTLTQRLHLTLTQRLHVTLTQRLHLTLTQRLHVTLTQRLHVTLTQRLHLMLTQRLHLMLTQRLHLPCARVKSRDCLEQCSGRKNISSHCLNNTKDSVCFDDGNGWASLLSLVGDWRLLTERGLHGDRE